MATKVRELGVSFVADFASERFDTRVDVSVLLQSRTCCKCFSALGTGVTTSSNVLGANVSLKIRWISENFATGFTDVSA